MIQRFETALFDGDLSLMQQILFAPLLVALLCRAAAESIKDASRESPGS